MLMDMAISVVSQVDVVDGNALRDGGTPRAAAPHS